MSRLTRDGTAEPVSRDQILRHARGQGNIHFPCSADHEQDWQPYPVDPYSAICDDHRYIHTYIHTYILAPLFVRRDGLQKTPGSTRYTPRYFLCFFLHPIKGHLQFFSTFLSATEFPHFCSCFLFFCFAIKDGLTFGRCGDGDSSGLSPQIVDTKIVF